LRSWLILPIAAIGSALVFGLMHGYEIIMLGPVITLGFTFAMMRHYRGSLIAPITAHALHNGTVMTLLISFITLANG
jgi:membrane protease YdiL (CAAX protease family)